MQEKDVEFRAISVHVGRGGRLLLESSALTTPSHFPIKTFTVISRSD